MPMVQRASVVARGVTDLVLVELAGHRLGLLAGNIREILPALTLVPIPEASGAIEGLALVRGAMIPVIDGRKRFGLPARPMEPADHLLVFRFGERTIAVHVDRVLGLVRCRVDAIDDLGSPVAPSAVGIATSSENSVVVHDVSVLLPMHETGPALAPTDHP
jgi:purine-binding chemotaxis protein CheW